MFLFVVVVCFFEILNVSFIQFILTHGYTELNKFLFVEHKNIYPTLSHTKPLIEKACVCVTGHLTQNRIVIEISPL